jgi:sorting nexin-29
MYALNNNLRNKQAGFCPHRSCVDEINSLKIITKQSAEFQSPLYLVFVDYRRAFDFLNRECIWKELKVRGLSSKFLNLIQEDYNSFSCRIYYNGHLSEPFLTISGVKQGCLLYYSY